MAVNKINVPTHKTLRLTGLTESIEKHMSFSGTDNVSQWIRDAIEFRLAYDTQGTGVLPSELSSNHPLDNSVPIASLLSEFNDFKGVSLTDHEMIIRLLLQLRSILVDGVGKVICENPNLNPQGLNLMDITKMGIEKSKEFVAKMRSEER